jgi:hypothetical protein
MEVWKKLEEYPLYEISSYGRLKNIKTGNIRTESKTNGYIGYTIRHEGKIKTIMAHRLVAQYFLPEPEPYILEWANTTKYGVPFINHKDGNKLNPKVDNLEWCTGSENTRHAIDNCHMSGTGRLGKLSDGVEPKKCLTDEEVLEIRKLFKPYDPVFGARALGKLYGVSGGYISNICNGTYRK